MLSAYRARAVWTGERWLDDATVVTEGATVVEVRPPRAEDGPPMKGLLCPGLVNAHTHLELTHLARRVPAAPDFPSWFTGMLEARREADSAGDAALNGAEQAVRLGTAVLMDISNAGDTGPYMEQAGLVGVCQHELLGFHKGDLPSRLADAARPARLEQGRGVWTRPGPHAPYSTPDALVQASSGPGPVPASIHLAEDPAELEFMARGEGAFAAVLDRLGRDWRWWEPPGTSPVAWLDSLGCLGPDLLLVHARHTGPEDLDRMAAAGAPVVLCPRSNRHIGGDLPPVESMVRAGLKLALGTDSLASSPDLDVLGEVAELVDALPSVDPELWLRSVTSTGADVLRLYGWGRLRPGTRPGLLLLEGIGAPRDLRRAPPRHWLVRPGSSLDA